jgi:hypothetical protein
MANDVLEAVARMGSILRGSRTKLPEPLFLQSRYLEHRENVTIDALEDFFANHPELVLAWAHYSVDPRCEYLGLATARFPGDSWKVIETNIDGSIRERLEFPTGARACAHFVRSYMETLALHAS